MVNINDADKNINDDDSDGNSGSSTSSIKRDIINIEKALIGAADLEEGILKQVQSQLDKMLNNIYESVKDYKKTAAKEILISETTITDADRAALAQGLSQIADGLNQKNVEIMRLHHELRLLGIETQGAAAGMSLEALRQKVNELTQRNRILRNIHGEMLMLTERIPKAVTLQSIQEMARELNKTLQNLSKANTELKQQIRQSAEKSPENKSDNETKSRFRR